MVDDPYANLSDEEIQRRADEWDRQHGAQPPAAEAAPPAATGGEDPYANLSDEEIQRRADEWDRQHNAPATGGVTFLEDQPPPKPTPTENAMETTAAALRGVRQGIPFARDIATGLKSAFSGVPFEEESARQQARDEALRKAHPLAYTAGEIGGMFVPLGAPARVLSLGKVAAGPSVGKLMTMGEEAIANRLGSYAGHLPGKLQPYAQGASHIVGTGAVGAGAGAVQGFGEGRDLRERMENAKSGAKWGAAFGAASPVVGKALGLSGPTKTELAADTLAGLTGKRVSVPSSVSSENWLARMLTPAISGFPLAKGFIDRGVRKGLQELEEAKGAVPGVATPGLNQYSSGKVASDAINDWIDKGYRTVSDPYWARVDRLIRPGVPQDLPNLRAAANRIMGERQDVPDKVGGAVRLIQDAAFNKRMIPYERMQYLKRVLGAKRSPLIAEPDMDRDEVKALYAALRQDILNATEATGGPAAKQAFLDATAQSAALLEGRKQLAALVGRQGNLKPESVFDRLVAAAAARGNHELLATAKAVIPPAAWNDIQSGVIQKLGKTNLKDFDPLKFAEQYNTMSPENKSLVFGRVGEQMRDAMDAIDTLSRRYAEHGKEKQLTNSVLLLSLLGTGGMLYAEGLPQGAIHDIMGLGAGVSVAFLLSRPRIATGFARMLGNPSPEMMTDLRNIINAEMRQVMTRPKFSPAVRSEDQENREGRAAGGKVGKRDYPAKRLTRMERAVKRAQDAIALETKPLMNMPDHTIAHALNVAKDN